MKKKRPTRGKITNNLNICFSSAEPRTAMFVMVFLFSSGWSVLFNMFVLVLYNALFFRFCQFVPLKSAPRTTVCYMCAVFPRVVCLFLVLYCCFIICTVFMVFPIFFLSPAPGPIRPLLLMYVCVCKASHVHVSMSLVSSVFHDCRYLVLGFVQALARRVHIATCSSSFARCHVHLVC